VKQGQGPTAPFLQAELAAAQKQTK